MKTETRGRPLEYKKWIDTNLCRFLICYPEGTQLETEANRLIKEIDAFGIPYKACSMPKELSSENLKRLAIKNLLIALEEDERDAVLIGADCEIKSFPEIFWQMSAAQEFDVAAHILAENKRPRIASGSIWVSNDRGGKQFIQKWNDNNHKFSISVSQNFIQLINKCRIWDWHNVRGVAFRELPEAYYRIKLSPFQHSPMGAAVIISRGLNR